MSGSSNNVPFFSSNSPIGIFDSGIGGLTVVKAILNELPNEELIYFGDTVHMPYGEKSPESITKYCLEITDFLVHQQCKAIVIACNSASAVAYSAIAAKLEDTGVVLLNVIDPVVRQISNEYNSRTIGIIGTKATIISNAYQEKIKKSNPTNLVKTLATPLLASMVEEGFYNNKISKEVLSEYLFHSELKEIDALILGCTHYPLIKNEIDELLGNRVAVFDSTINLANELRQQLMFKKLLRHSKAKVAHQFFVSDFTLSFHNTAKTFFGKQIKLIEKKMG